MSATLPLRRVLATSYWLKIYLEHVFQIDTVLARSDADLLRELDESSASPFDLVVLGDRTISLDTEKDRRLGRHLESLPLLTYGGWSSYDRGGWDQSAVNDQLPVRIEPRGFEQSFVRLRATGGSDILATVEDLPPSAGWHRLHPRPGTRVQIIAKQTDAPLAVSGRVDSQPRLCLAMSLHAGGSQEQYFHRAFAAYLRSCLALASEKSVPPASPTDLGGVIAATGQGEVGRAEISSIVEEGIPGLEPIETVGFCTVVAILHRYYDFAEELERTQAELQAKPRERVFRLSRADQMRAYGSLLQSDYRRASQAFSSASQRWLSMIDQQSHGATTDLGFARTWGGMADLCMGLSEFILGSPAATSYFRKATSTLRDASKNNAGHAAARAYSKVPTVLLSVERIRALQRISHVSIPDRAWKPVELLAKRMLGAESTGDPAAPSALVDLVKASLSEEDRARRLVESARNLDAEFAQGNLSSRTWLILSSLFGLWFTTTPGVHDVVPRPPVFFSYSGKDVSLIDDVRATLESRGIHVVQDKTHLRAGSGLGTGLEGAVRSCNSFVMFASKNSLHGPSRWIPLETIWAHAGETIPAFIPVILEDVRLPALLATRVGLDARGMDGEQIGTRLLALFAGLDDADSTAL